MINKWLNINHYLCFKNEFSNEEEQKNEKENDKALSYVWGDTGVNFKSYPRILKLCI